MTNEEVARARHIDKRKTINVIRNYACAGNGNGKICMKMNCVDCVNRLDYLRFLIYTSIVRKKKGENMYWRNYYLRSVSQYLSMGYTRKEAEEAALRSVARKNVMVAGRLRRENRIR